MLKIGLIGAGVMGRTHRAAYKKLSNVQLTVICDIDLEKAQKLADGEIAVVQNYEEVLNDPNIDVVDICLPTYLHKQVVLEAAAKGKHVFCEKPISLSLEDAQEMIDACDKAGVKLGVGHVVRFFPDYAKAKTAVETGVIGDAKVVRTSRSGAFPAWSEDNWYADYSRSGGPIVDLIIHDFDFLRWMFGPIKRVFAKTITGKHEMLDHALVNLRFENGIIAHVEGSWAQPPGSPFTTSLEIAGTEGLYDYTNQKSMPLILRTSQGTAAAVQVPESPLALDPYAAELKAFFTCILEDKPVPVSGTEAKEALRIALAAKQSAETGEVIWLGGKDNA